MEPFCSRRKPTRVLKAGFTLVELMVVFTIIVTITSIVLTSQSTFNRTLILSNTAYDIALTLRSAQTYGLSSRVRGTAAKNVGHGIHVQTGSPSSFTLFADTFSPPSCGEPDCKPGDRVYTGADTLVQTYNLNNGMVIDNFCALSNFSWSCASNGGLTSLDIVFARPNAEPFMSKDGSYSELSPVTIACLRVSSPQGGYRYVSVGASGQIIASAAACGP